MTPVYQTILRAPGGNCFQACVASVLDLPLKEVPHFFQTSQGGPWTQADWNAVREFASSRGYEVCWLDPDMAEHEEGIRALKQCGLHYIVTGASPRHAGYGHCVVGYGGEIVHDPVESASGPPLGSDPWLYLFFLRKIL